MKYLSILHTKQGLPHILQLLNSYPLLIHDHGLICNVLIIDDMRHGDSSTRVVFSYFLISMN